METEYWVCKQCEYGVSGPKYGTVMTNLIDKHERETNHTMQEVIDD